jgi:DNA polymerase-3 subunit delta
MALPSVYLFYGDDLFGIEQALDSLRLRLGTAANLDLLQLAGPALDLGTLQQACISVPFLAERRLVIVQNAEDLPAGDQFQQALIQIMDTVPETSALVFAAHVLLDRRNLQAFQKRSVIFAWAIDNPDISYIKQFASPRGAAFASWLMERAEQLGGQLDQQAAELLSGFIEEDVLLGDQELQKLITFVAEGQSVSVADVEQLTPIYGQADIFEAIDSLGAGSGSFVKLQRLLEEQDPSYVFLMVVRQFRLLLQARHALDQGSDPVEAMKVPAFVARKVTAQARRFSLPVLESMFHRLQDFDLKLKRGDADSSLDLIPLIASLSVIPAPSKPNTPG